MSRDLGTIPPEQQPYDSPELRGVIVVDTNILYNLYAGVTGEFRGQTKHTGEKTLRRYLDALRFLSNHGYEVIIPEMVSYEAENVLVGGSDVDRYFRKDDDERNKLYRAELKKFLHDAAGGKRYPHIRIMPNYEPEDVARFLGEMHEVVDHNDKPSPQITRKLVKLQKIDRKHFGDRAIAAMLTHDDGIRSFSKHFFVLSDDHEVLRHSSRYPDVNLVNTMGFLDALIKSGIWEGVGMAAATDAHEVMDSIAHQAELATGSQRRTYYANTDYTADDYRRYSQGIKIPNRRHPFEESLQGLFKDLGWAKQADTAQTGNGEQVAPISRVEQYRRKFGFHPRDGEYNGLDINGSGQEGNGR